MTYVMSDIHGEYEKFCKMLELTKFSECDTMYVLGDVFDRGPHPTRTLLRIMSMPNIKMVMGNHERMFLDSDSRHVWDCWMGNGGDITFEHFSNLSPLNQKNIKTYVSSLPLVLFDDNFIFVHAGITKDVQYDDYCLWARDEFIHSETGFDKTVVFGHTPTQLIREDREPKIWYGNGKIGIDCGCCFPGGRLACLRLDDMKEFYV